MADRGNKKRVYCSAGISHLLLYPNGDVYRCMADYNAKFPALFNAKDGWKKIEHPLLCKHDSCYAGCDIDSATRWISDDKGNLVQTIKAQCANMEPSNRGFWAEQTMEHPLRDKVHILWAPSLVCNYDCHYCGCAGGSHNIYKDFPSSHPELKLEEWIGIWDQIYKSYEFGIVSISGGEPFLSRATLPIMDMLSDKFAINVTTNLSLNAMKLARAGVLNKKSKSRAGLKFFVASMHPTARGFNRELFLGSLLYLKNNGINVFVNYVGHPLQLFLAPEYKKWLRRHKIPFSVLPWCGLDNEGYQARYSDAELKFLNKITGIHSGADTRIKFNEFSYSADIPADTFEVGQNDVLILKGRIKNTGTCTWTNSARAGQDFCVGARILYFGEERDPLRDFRSPLAAGDIAPGEAFDFEIKIDTNGLEAGYYSLKLDLLKEKEFWFEDKGASALLLRLKILKNAYASEVLEVDLPKTIPAGRPCRARLKIKNAGKIPWDPSEKKEKIWAGCRMYEIPYAPGKTPIKESRALLPSAVKPEEIVEVEMDIDSKGVRPGKYVFAFDMVNEDRFWFREKGSKCYTTEAAIS